MPAPCLQPYAVPNATTVSIDAATTINASATETGNGGKVIVWSNQATTFYGTILAKGGAQSGNGGFVETSGGTLDLQRYGQHVGAERQDRHVAARSDRSDDRCERRRDDFGRPRQQQRALFTRTRTATRAARAPRERCRRHHRRLRRISWSSTNTLTLECVSRHRRQRAHREQRRRQRDPAGR